MVTVLFAGGSTSEQEEENATKSKLKEILLAGGSTSEQEDENATKSKLKEIDPLLFH